MLPARIATRFLSSSKGQTALIVIGIAIAISVQVFVGTLIMSLQSGLIERTIGRSPHISITSADQNVTFGNYINLVEEVKGVDGVSAVSFSVDSNAFAVSGNRSEPVLVRGLDLINGDKIYRLKSALYQGSMPTTGQVLMGRDLQEKLGIELGSTLTVATAKGTKTNVTVSGFYDLNVASINKVWLITDASSSRSIFGYGDVVTKVEIMVKDPFNADKVAGQISKKISDPKLIVTNWKEENEELLSGLSAQTASSNMIQGFILVSVIIAIASILAITVLQKSKQIGILKAMGIKDRDASLIFIIEGLFLGLMGSIVGIILGVGLLASFTTFVRDSSGASILALQIEPMFILQSWIIAVVSSVIAAALPARRSARLDPIEVIRNG